MAINFAQYAYPGRTTESGLSSIGDALDAIWLRRQKEQELALEKQKAEALASHYRALEEDQRNTLAFNQAKFRREQELKRREESQKAAGEIEGAIYSRNPEQAIRLAQQHGGTMADTKPNLIDQPEPAPTSIRGIGGVTVGMESPMLQRMHKQRQDIERENQLRTENAKGSFDVTLPEIGTFRSTESGARDARVKRGEEVARDFGAAIAPLLDKASGLPPGERSMIFRAATNLGNQARTGGYTSKELLDKFNDEFGDRLGHAARITAAAVSARKSLEKPTATEAKLGPLLGFLAQQVSVIESSPGVPRDAFEKFQRDKSLFEVGQKRSRTNEVGALITEGFRSLGMSPRNPYGEGMTKEQLAELNAIDKGQEAFSRVLSGLNVKENEGDRMVTQLWPYGDDPLRKEKTQDIRQFIIDAARYVNNPEMQRSILGKVAAKYGVDLSPPSEAPTGTSTFDSTTTTVESTGLSDDELDAAFDMAEQEGRARKPAKKGGRRGNSR